MTMPRPPVMPAEDKIRIVFALLSGEMTVAEAARRHSRCCWRHHENVARRLAGLGAARGR